MSTSAVPRVIDYLVTTFRAAPTIGAATPPVHVFDGPEVTGEAHQMVLWVAMTDPDSETASIAAESQQQWAALGTRWLNEEITIHCVAECWSGDTSIYGARAAAYSIVNAVQELLRGDANLGANILFLSPGVMNQQLRQYNTDQGAVVRVAFQIAGKARIGG